MNLDPQTQFDSPEEPEKRRRLRDGWYQNYKLQTNSLTGPILIMAVSGSHIVWGISSPEMRKHEWHLNTLPNEQVMVIISWYIGAIIGSVLLNFLLMILSKRLIYFIGALLCVLSSVLMAVFPQHMIALIAARLTAGLGHGLVFICGIMHGAANSSNDFRVNVVGLFSVMMYISMIFTSTITSISPDADNGLEWDTTTIISVVNGVFSVIAVIVGPIAYQESVVDLVEKGEDQMTATTMAAMVMAELRTVDMRDEYIQKDLADITAMIEEDKDQNISPLQEGNQRAMGLTILARMLNVLTMNYAFNMIKIGILNVSDVKVVSTFVPYAIRGFLGFFMLLLINMIGRKRLLAISGSLAGVTMLILAIVVTVTDNLGIITMIIIIIFDVATAIGVIMIPDILLSEAFSLKKRISSGMLACIVEFVVHIMIVGITYDVDLNEYRIYILYAFGALVFLISVALYFFLPITDNLHIRHARAAFRSRENTNAAHMQS